VAELLDVIDLESNHRPKNLADFRRRSVA